MKISLAYYNWSRWVADCPEDDCGDAREVFPGVIEDVCAGGHPFQIQMPPQRVAGQIVAELSKRTCDADRGWYPRGHARAEVHGFLTGQTLAELQAETREVEAIRGRQRGQRREVLLAALAEYGIDVTAEGRFEGSI